MPEAFQAERADLDCSPIALVSGAMAPIGRASLKEFRPSWSCITHLGKASRRAVKTGVSETCADWVIPEAP
jgi:hypothetical protein